MVKRISRGLVALSSSAIAAIYAAGYVRTAPAAANIAAAEAGSPTPSVLSAAATPGLPAAVRPGATPTVPLGLVSPATTVAAGYQDGTYTGHGTSRRGNVDVQVTIQGGRITGAAITRSTTSYPISRISALPGQVVARQSAQVDVISGATLSARAYQQAVSQALAQAQGGTGVQQPVPAAPAAPVTPARNRRP